MRDVRLRDLALEESPVARIVVEANGVLAMVNQKARVLFSLKPKDIGRPLQDLEISYRPTELRSLIEQAYAERRPVTQTSVERCFADGERQYFDIVVAPLFDDAQSPLGVGITFLDVTRYSRLSEELQRSREEIQTANEELQSTNEELETMNEELQSTNEELQTVNEELRQRTEEMNQLNAFLESVLTSLRAAAVVVNQNLSVLIWNRRAEDLWGLRQEEIVGQHFLNLDIGLPTAQLRPLIRRTLAGEAGPHEMVLPAVNRRGRTIEVRVVGTPLSRNGEGTGAILIMDLA
jgi:two-component system CheB/CheR fusion protein